MIHTDKNMVAKVSCLCAGKSCISSCREIILPKLGACSKESSGKGLPTSQACIGKHQVTMLRDSGCTGVVVKKSLVQKHEMTGELKPCRLIDGSVLYVPMANIRVDTPYYTGEVEAMCMHTPIHDLIIGNICGARNAYDPDVGHPLYNTMDPLNEASAVVTRSQTMKGNKLPKSLVVSEPQLLSEPVTAKVLQELQEKDAFVRQLTFNDKRHSKGKVMWYEKRNGLVYKVSKSLQGTHVGKVYEQLLVPRLLRKSVMTVAHEAVFAGHMGVRKTSNRVKACFVWSGMDGDISRFCRSCDICQRTVPKGKVSKVPLGIMPLIDTPFKRVGIDLIGPIIPASNRGHRYILTIIDYATRYPEAVALRNICTVDVAEAMLKVFSRVGIPEEVLSDLGSQFTSDLMKEVSRLLSIRSLHTTPYNPRCNGLCEKMNGTLKSMLKKLSAEKPKDWDRYLDPLLFAYREVPQDSTNFSPFELLYGRSVRGPLQILKETWTNQTNDMADDEVKSSYEYVLDLKNRLEETCKLARVELAKSQVKYRKFYNRKARDRFFKVNDKVLLLLPTSRNKLLLQWKGPFRVIEKTSPCDYKIDIAGVNKVFHINMLKQYFERVESDSTLPIEIPAAVCAIIEHDESHDEDDDTECMYYEKRDSNKVSNVKISENLNKCRNVELTTMLESFPDVFSDRPGNTDLVEHKIDTTSVEPVRTKPYPVPYNMRSDIRKEIQDMLELKVIEESNSPYGSPIVMIKKRDGSNRFCVDYRKLNKISIFDPEPMVKPDDLFTQVRGDKFFSKLDLSKGYWQIRMCPKDKPKTAFLSPENGCFQFRRMPFGLMNSAATFNRMMRKLLVDMPFVCNYIDDILVHTKTWSEHIAVLQELFCRLRKANLTIKASKCMFAYAELGYVGHTISGTNVGVTDENIQKIVGAPRPISKKMVKSFNGLVGYYRNHIPNLADLLYPLTELTKKGQPNTIEWKAEHEHAFSTLKQKLVSKPILQLPNFEKGFVVQVDASGYGLGAALLQYHKGELLPVAYASRKLLPRELSYATIEKECLAVVYAVQKFKNYLYGKEFVLQTDHRPLIYINHNKSNNDRIMRWSLLLQPYAMKIESISGRENVIADYLSRAEAD
jgi:hypothetical protein